MLGSDEYTPKRWARWVLRYHDDSTPIPSHFEELAARIGSAIAMARTDAIKYERRRVAELQKEKE